MLVASVAKWWPSPGWGLRLGYGSPSAGAQGPPPASHCGLAQRQGVVIDSNQPFVGKVKVPAFGELHSVRLFNSEPTQRHSWLGKGAG